MTAETEKKKQNRLKKHKYVTCPDLLEKDESFILCTKADALRSTMMFKESIPKYLRAILLNRENLEAYYGLALSYKHLQEFPKAVSTLEKALNIDSKNKDINYELGICLLLDGKPAEAMNVLRDAIKLDNKNLNAQVQLAIAHELCDEDEMALLIYDKINEEAPDYFKAHQHKAALLMSLEEYKEACSIFYQILKLNPKYEKAILGIGICFDKLKRFTDAVRYYRKFLMSMPTSEHFSHVRERISKIKLFHKRKNTLTVVSQKQSD